MSNIHLGKGSQPPTFPEDGKLRLYSMRFCPFAQRVHLVLEAKNIPYHTAYINLKQKPEWYTQKSPLGKVPALEIPTSKDDPLIESLIIADYLDDQYPQNRLNSTDPLQRARDRILIERFNGFITPYYKLMFSQTGVDGAPGAITDAINALDVFEAELKKRGSKFFNGSKPGFVDYMIWPWCERTDAFAFLLGDKYELDKVRFSKLIEWKDLMKEDNAIKSLLISGEDHYKFRRSTFRAEGPDYDFLPIPAKRIRTN
ncbi:CLUMA_CG013351, isoform A [Clunio marinus]|uniref:CLUMA_CG013351, isoform A n=1 Tax=Clunio marinus TaxID=568069 RepID=A0A1J1INK6_9DIPT|nr:CLUMA_CG013351, isoform A [Clunio marinus]